MNLTIWSLNRAAQLLAELAGGKVAQGIIDEAAGQRLPFSNGVEHHYIESLLGLELASEAVSDIFKRLGLPAKVLNKDGKIFYEVMVPTRRNDLRNQEDLIEEVGRLYGYENIESKMPFSIILPSLKDENLIYTDEVRDMMVGLGYSEAFNYSFVGLDESRFYGFKDLVDVLNPLSQDQKYLRPNLFVGLIKNLQENLKNWHSLSSKKHALRLFEIGHAFHQEKKEIIEKKKVAGILYLSDSQKNQTFYELKGALETMLNGLGLAEAWTDSHLEEGLPKNYLLNPKRTAQIKSHDKILGYLGELDPKISDELGISGQPALFELDFEALVQSVDAQRKYEPPSKFPANIRDLSVLVDSQVKIDEVAGTIENAGGELLQDSELFDLYEGDDLANEQKSLAFHLIFQSNERNLTDPEVNEIMDKIISALEKKGWEIRK
jgi:phenylalanyl-tRNA synthetase beta chain